MSAVLLILLVVVFTAFTSACGDEKEEADVPVVDAGVVRTFEIASRKHVTGKVVYEQTPPVGGDHSSAWQECGYYDRVIVPERGVHSMEHGAVWITFRDGLGRDGLRRLRELAEGRGHVLVSRWDGNLPAPVVASAWGRQVKLRSAFDPELQQFVDMFAGGPQAPEQGVRC
ncbi:MAG: DUF3105 domain-containing protein [Actinomycetota bacterium]|nr:DUF3105 domain-containing protein [Actinomycetota bacterium]